MNHVESLLINKILKTKDQTYFDNQVLNKKQQLQLLEYQEKIQKGYPVDYILGSVKFLDHDFFVKEDVFIPRWETEWWLTEIIKAKNFKNNIFSSSTNQVLNLTDLVVEIGSGSGIIGLSLCPYFKEVLACDLNPKAINLTKKNQQHLNIKNYQVYESNLFENKKLRSKGLLCKYSCFRSYIAFHQRHYWN